MFTDLFRSRKRRKVNSDGKCGSTNGRFEPPNLDNWYQSAGDLEDVRTLEHIYEPLVKSIYAFWKGYTGLPCEIFPYWSLHEDSIEERKN
jgi:hypothetical protein